MSRIHYLRAFFTVIATHTRAGFIDDKVRVQKRGYGRFTVLYFSKRDSYRCLCLMKRLANDFIFR